MRKLLTTTLLVSAIATYPAVPILAQSTSEATEAETDSASQDGDEEFVGLTEEELDELMAPVALFPDTLLIQILVASTYPLELIKAQRFLADNEGLEQDALTEAAEAEPWDPSVQVLATAFPDVLNRMADNVDWTEMTGNAMLAQYDDVMDSVQRLREEAIDAGSLVDTEEQEVTRDETEAVVIVPSDPEVIYVPTYDSNTVYYQNNDAVIFFTTVILIGAIYHSNHHWHNYWGCRSCCGYNGRPIHYRPGGINVNGDINIGNNVGNNWKPEPRREARAKENLRDHANNGGRDRPGKGASTMPAMKDRDSRGDAMRKDLSDRTGAKDISKPGNRPAAGQGGDKRPKDAARPATADRKRPAGGDATKRSPAPKKNIAPNRTKPSHGARPSGGGKKASPSSFQRKQSGGGARKSSSRGGGNRGGGRRRR